jgi:hypothetical protein
VALLAITFGLILGILGAGFYYATDMVSITALIPAFFGVALLVFGVLALGTKWRMHAMHGAALLGLIGLVVPGFMAVREYGKGAEMNGTKVAEMGIMAVLCGVFLVLCVKSFIDARRRRRQQANP